ncbi:acyltransferase [Synechococcus sp. WH 8109]|uniref:acyltransferase family protein n=1 Tax=Synechococcus sp. WH 8109 TaxID=166314 RepID=UPI0001B8DC55|nr:acyltransferase [Synechococcus sp. WH 8109]
MNRSRLHLNGLTGLRFIAAMAIFVLHARNHDLIPDFILSTFDLSKSVSLFFVLSGFVISYAYSHRSPSFVGFIRARLARIWPAAVLSILLVIFLLPRTLYLPAPDSGWSTFSILLISLLGLQAWIPIPAFYFSFNAVLWSISVELFFYICFPFLRKFSVVRLLAIFALLFISILSIASFLAYFESLSYGVNVHNNFVWQGLIYINPISRLPEFVLGIIGCRIVYSNSFSKLYGIYNRKSSYHLKMLSKASSTVSTILFIYLIFHGYDWGATVPVQLVLNRMLSSMCCILLITGLVASQGLLVQFLERPFMAALGQASYGMYLYHQPLMIRAAQAGGIKFAGIQILPSDFTAVLVWTLILSFVSYRFFEEPLNTFFRTNYQG